MNTPPFRMLTSTERRVVLACMRFFRLGPDFDEEEYTTVLGIDPEELDRIIGAWPNIDDSDPDSPEVHAINNCMVLARGSGYLGRRPEQWGEWFDVPPDEVDRIFSKWRKLQNDPVDYGADDE